MLDNSLTAADKNNTAQQLLVGFIALFMNRYNRFLPWSLIHFTIQVLKIIRSKEAG
jgi:hypothetical protein